MHRSFHKPHTMTSETRVSNSNIFNNSYLMNTSAPQLNNAMSNKIKESENREIEFLREKNFQLGERVKRMTHALQEMEESNRVLLEMNRKYVQVVNRYYENSNKKAQGNLKRNASGRKKVPESEFEQQNINIENLSGKDAHRLLEQLQKDHRNLTKHCLVMQQQIKNYNQQIVHYNQMKDELYAVNHTSVKELIQELEQLTLQNKSLKKQNNGICYELEKYKFEHDNLKKKNGQQELQAGNTEVQMAKMRSIVSTVKQESEDRSKAYESRIYELELKVQKLESQLRCGQQSIFKTKEQRKQLVMKHVEQVHDFEKLQKSYKELECAIANRDKKRAYSMNTKKVNSSMHNIFENDVNTINQLNGLSVQKVRKSKLKKEKKCGTGISALI